MTGTAPAHGPELPLQNDGAVINTGVRVHTLRLVQTGVPSCARAFTLQPNTINVGMKVGGHMEDNRRVKATAKQSPVQSIAAVLEQKVPNWLNRGRDLPELKANRGGTQTL